MQPRTHVHPCRLNWFKKTGLNRPSQKYYIRTLNPDPLSPKQNMLSASSCRLLASTSRLVICKSKSRLLSTSSTTSKNFIIPGDSASLAVIEKSSSKKIYYFTATWCPPCKAIAPKFEALSSSSPSVNFVKIDIDNFESAAVKYGIRSVPTFVFANGAKILSQFSGADEGQLKKSIEALEKSS